MFSMVRAGVNRLQDVALTGWLLSLAGVKGRVQTTSTIRVYTVPKEIAPSRK